MIFFPSVKSISLRKNVWTYLNYFFVRFLIFRFSETIKKKSIRLKYPNIFFSYKKNLWYYVFTALTNKPLTRTKWNHGYCTPKAWFIFCSPKNISIYSLIYYNLVTVEADIFNFQFGSLFKIIRIDFLFEDRAPTYISKYSIKVFPILLEDKNKLCFFFVSGVWTCFILAFIFIYHRSIL